jgi:hypothetical protein
LSQAELFIFVSPIAMAVGLWLILRQKPAGKDKDDAPGPS